MLFYKEKCLTELAFWFKSFSLYTDVLAIFSSLFPKYFTWDLSEMSAVLALVCLEMSGSLGLGTQLPVWRSSSLVEECVGSVTFSEHGPPEWFLAGLGLLCLHCAGVLCLHSYSCVSSETLDFGLHVQNVHSVQFLWGERPLWLSPGCWCHQDILCSSRYAIILGGIGQECWINTGELW